jgi:uncharacterized membrane protein YjgN (DUF898 family)
MANPIDPMSELGGMWGRAPAAGRGAAPPIVAPPLPPVPSVAPPAGATVPRSFVFHGSGGSLFGIWIVNVLLTLVTFGIYHFWAKTRVRRYLASQTEVDGDRFAYHGTGAELLVGALKAAVFFAVPFLLYNVPQLLPVGWVAQIGGIVLGYAIVLLLIPIAIVGTRRYRLSRTSWRSIRFSFRGPVREFMNLYLRGVMLSVITLGIYYPYFVARRHGYLTARSYFGNERFDWDGRGAELFPIYALTVLLWLPTLGFYWFWFQARKQRYLWDHTTLGSARFRFTATGGALLGLKLVNFLLLVVTLGLASPWVTVRNAGFVLRHLHLEGALDVARIEQEAQQASATGEGLAGFLDTGFEFEF